MSTLVLCMNKYDVLSSTKQRVNMDIQKESLIILLSQFQENKEKKWSCEKELIQKEICSLKTQLEEAQAKHVHSSQENKNLKSQLRTQWKPHSVLERQISNCIYIQVKLAQAEKLQEKLGNLEKDLLKRGA